MTGTSRNIVLVTVDSLRADHCGFLGSEWTLTPTIDRLADAGVSFRQAVAPGPRTPSSLPALFTGEFVSREEDWRMTDWQGRQRRIGAHMSRFTHLSERLRRRGYETAAFTANPWTTRESNFHLGFDEFDEVSADGDIPSEHLSDSRLFTLADRGFEILPGDPVGWSNKKEWFSQWPGYFGSIRDRLRGLSEPFFLWVFILDTHQPYITPRRFRAECSALEMYYSVLRYWRGEVADTALPPHARSMIARTYRDAVRSVDGFVAALTETADAYDPITILLADHGEALGEHGNFGHERTLYEENLRVPCFVHGVGQSAVVREQFPLRAASDLVVDLVSPGGFEPERYTRQFVISTTENGHKTAVRTARWKLLVGDGPDRLYDRRSDPSESNDVRSSHPGVAAALRDLYDRHEATQAEKAATEAATEALVTEERGSL